MDKIYLGVRFAPSPTGRFHVGNLRTAWVSHCWAKALREPWVVRFEDIDLPRVVPGAADLQLADMKAVGLEPDLTIFQRSRIERHFSLFRDALESGVLYPCRCSRKDVQEALAGLASAPHGELPIYTGQCRTGSSGLGPVAWRFRGSDPSGARDFIVARTPSPEINLVSFQPAYHWACAIDDYDGKYSLLVRAIDLATSTPLQREIQAWISHFEKREWSPPAVFHTSLVTANDGGRLEKRTAGVTLSELLAAGRSLEDIREAFRLSFKQTSFTFSPSEILSESALTLKIQDLFL